MFEEAVARGAQSQRFPEAGLLLLARLLLLLLMLLLQLTITAVTAITSKSSVVSPGGAEARRGRSDERVGNPSG